MSRTQKTILAIGLLLMALAALFPPRVYFGQGPGYASPSRGFLYTREFTGKPCSIEFEKLLVEWVFIAALTSLGVVLAANIDKELFKEGNSEDIRSNAC